MRAARRNDGKLCHGEEAVEHEQRQDDDDFEDQHSRLSIRPSIVCKVCEFMRLSRGELPVPRGDKGRKRLDEIFGTTAVSRAADRAPAA